MDVVLIPAAAAAIAALLKRRRCPRCGQFLAPTARSRDKRPRLHDCPTAHPTTTIKQSPGHPIHNRRTASRPKR